MYLNDREPSLEKLTKKYHAKYLMINLLRISGAPNLRSNEIQTLTDFREATFH